jgi:capsular polysaccharide export protein
MTSVFSRKMSKIPHLKSFIDDEVCLYSWRFKKTITQAAGWGVKKSAQKARRFAEQNALPYISVEDGFLRSFRLGVDGYPSLSLVVDNIGIYYDAARPSLLENLLNSEGWERPELMMDAQRAMSLIIEHNLSKYNHAPDADISIIKGSRKKRVLIVDQTFNDMSVVLGMADEGSFRAMYDAALKENPDADIYIKVHPDVIAGKKRGYLTDIRQNDHTFIIGENLNPLSLMRLMDRVYAATSQVGFEALLLNKPVTCFGMPFYAGWGLTDDRISCPRRVKKRTVLEVFAAAYIKYARYINPATGERGTIFDVIEHLIRQKHYASMNSHDYYCFGFRWWKHGHVRPFLQGPHNRVIFVKDAKDALQKGLNRQSRILVWGHNETEEIRELAFSLDIPIWRVEDGFIRSVGLGSDLIPPMSLVIDRCGIYYDPQKESDLERILNNCEFTPAMLERAEKLRQLIVNAKITKYNTEPLIPLKIKPRSQKVIFVPGQVQDDASIRLGAGSIRTNEGLLKTVRHANPGAFIIYKPHPDVMAKNRKGHASQTALKDLCDHIETRAGVISCIEASDEIHTITSQTGFDALIMGKRVVVYGGPFYAGWGLTIDHMPLPGRIRNLTLNELVAGALILYPVYFDRRTNGFVECETIIERIIEERGMLPHNDRHHNAHWQWIRRQTKKGSVLAKEWTGRLLLRR